MISIYLSCLFIAFATALPRVDKYDTSLENYEIMAEIEEYLLQFSDYQKPQELTSFWESDSYKDSLIGAKRELGLEENTEITSEFLDLIRQDRCGNSESKESLAFSAVLKWPNKNDITYCIDYDNLHPTIPVSKQVGIFEQGLIDWNKYANFKVRRVAFPKGYTKFWKFQLACGIAFRFAPKYHDYMHSGSNYNFDGRGKVLAHATLPQDGDIHYDMAEPWATDGSSGTKDLYSVTIHELGHSLGLAHSRERSAVMYPIYGYKKKISSDDINGIRALYG
ncbi:DgyrCDS13345 [Dimorphilus gyrociliatus]|uniref:DgyrCDS13345 n=1 Tax=Dimorphilus gyrociliatus TaxID=2664684 RepID=A0A7I8WAF0_9ANNE|nr:DgyrCDS13345 [Dimorphilus gyrociliatus]